jgi:hypothetical protein
VGGPGNHVVTDNPEASRYELRIDGRLAGRIDYRLTGDTISLDHAVVERSRRGRGLGNILVAGTIADVAKRNLKIDPRCPFVAAYVSRHPELQRILKPS